MNRRVRRVVRTWLPTAVIGAICVAVVIGAVAMQNSWWTAPAPKPAADQQAADGMSRFDRAGVDYFTRAGAVRVRIGDDALPADELGLAAEGESTIEPLVPVRAVVLADEPLVLEAVSSVSVTSTGNRVTAVTLMPDTGRSWQSVSGELERTALTWGWTEGQLARLSSDLAAAAQGGDGGGYSAALPRIPSRGALVSAAVVVDGGVTVSFTIEPAL